MTFAKKLLALHFNVVCATYAFDIVPKGQKFIQILHDCDLHWDCLFIMPAFGEDQQKENMIHQPCDPTG